MKKFTKLSLAAVAVAVVGLLSYSCIIVVEGDTEVRYTWEGRYTSGTSTRYHISSVAASYDDVARWKRDWYYQPSYSIDDATDIPIKDGSPDIPDNIYSETIKSTYFKGRYLPITLGKYTAVCTVEDQYGYFDIVANYNITANNDGSTKYFEIAFDVTKFVVTDKDSDAWRSIIYDNPNTGPSLEKAPVKRLVKKIEAGDVTYYVLRRPAKN